MVKRHSALGIVSNTGYKLEFPTEGWEDRLEKEMAIHSSASVWKTPWTVEPGRLQSMGLQRVGHD